MGRGDRRALGPLFALLGTAGRELTAAMVEGPGPLVPVPLAEPQPLCGSSIDSESTPPETPNNAAPAAPPKDAPLKDAPLEIKFTGKIADSKMV